MARLVGSCRSCGGQLRPPNQPAWNQDMAARSNCNARPATWNSLDESGEGRRRNWTYRIAVAGAPSTGRQRNGPAGRCGRHGSGEAIRAASVT